MRLIGIALCHNGYRDRIHLEHSVNRQSLRTIGSEICMLSKYMLGYPDKALGSTEMLCEGLAYVAAYLFIPYGEDGLNYVKEKIHPQPIELFLRQRAEYLLEKTFVMNDPDCQQFISDVFEYCQCFSQKVLPTSPVSATMLLARIESELIKNPVNLSYSTPESDRTAFREFILYRHEHFKKLGQLQLDSLDLDLHCAQFIPKYPFNKPFVFTDAHRKEIDHLPIFTCLAK